MDLAIRDDEASYGRAFWRGTTPGNQMTLSELAGIRHSMRRVWSSAGQVGAVKAGKSVGAG